MLFGMMSAADYRAKARIAQANARQARDPLTRLQWTEIADHWLGLVKVGTAQEAVERGLPDERPLTWTPAHH